jgi:CRP/FNR family transcriptional regulator, anaerobic regulatory protein
MTISITDCPTDRESNTDPSSITSLDSSKVGTGRRKTRGEAPPSSSSLQDVCNLLRLDLTSKQQTKETLELPFRHRQFKAGELIYRMGQTFTVLYIVQYGFLKTVLRNAEGDERVLSFPMKSDLLGFDGIYRNRYTSDTVALTDCDLIALPFKQLLTPGHANGELEQMLYLATSREIALERGGMGLSITVKSEARVARFLAMQARRYTNLGYSSKNFLLPMTRRDMGSFLGLTLETVSRSLSALAAAGIISVNRRDIHILRPELLILPHNFPLMPEEANKSEPRRANASAPPNVNAADMSAP